VTKDAQRQLLAEQQAQSVYKLAILRKYLTPMMRKLATLNAPIVLVDGFAGTGSSGDAKGSSALMLDHATPNKYLVPVSVHAVEADAAHFDKLQEVVDAAVGAGCEATATHGTIEDNLSRIVEQAAGKTLFLFLDPYGANVPYSLLERTLASDRGARFPVTEALLNISCPLIFREAGIVRGGSIPSQTKAIDDALGGDWWHQYVGQDMPSEELVTKVTVEYAHRLARAARMTPVLAPIYRHPRHIVPKYYLAYFTRSADHGVATFIDAVGRGRPDYMEATEDAITPTLFGDTAAEQAHEQAKEEAQATVPHIKTNLLRLAGRHATFCPLVMALDVYGTDAGVATETQVNAAIKALLDENRLREVQKPKNSGKRMQGTYALATAAGISSQN